MILKSHLFIVENYYLEFINAIKSLRLEFSDREIDILVKSMNFIDESNIIDTYYFIRKLERAGIEDENEEEQILGNFIESIKKSGMSLKNVFELFDSSGDGLIGKDEFKFALNQLNLNISDETISKILCIITGDIHQFIGYCHIPFDPCMILV